MPGDGGAPTPSDPRFGRRIRVLFLCVGNSARSIMAEALLRERGGDSFEARSAGTEPKGVNPLTLRTLAAGGVPANDLRSESVEAYLGQRFDYVITLCDEAREACPYLPGSHMLLHWDLPDPAAVSGDEATRLSAFRSVFEALEARLATFVREATPSAPESSGHATPSEVR